MKKIKLLIILVLSLGIALTINHINHNDSDIKAIDVQTIDPNTIFSLLTGNGSNFPDFYGGAFVSEDQSTLYIHVVGDLNDARQAIKELTQADNFVLLPAVYSYKELLSISDLIYEKVLNNHDQYSYLNQLTWWGPNDQTNRFFVGILDINQEKIDWFKSEVINHTAIDFEDGVEITLE